jgi:tetratricopeptide (TPR) repeat protein
LYDDALVYFESVEPSEYFLPAQIEIAGVQQDLGDLEAGRRHLRELAQAFPDFEIAALSADADLLVEAGRPEEALGIYDEAIATHPDAIELRYSKSFLLEKQGRVDEAIELLRAILAETPEDPIALNALGYTLADRTDELDEARRLIARALEADPLNAAIIDSMGWVLYKQGDTAGALHYLWRARILSRDPEIATHLGEVLWVTGAEDEARRIWDEALSEYPDSEVLREVMERFGR